MRDFFRLSRHNPKIKGEELIGVKLCTYLLEKMYQGKCPYIWTHVANEGFGKGGALKGARLRNQGKWAGVYDYVFTSSTKCLWLELKTQKGRISPAQKQFSDWCTSLKVPHFVAYSFEEAIEILIHEKIVFD